MADLSKVFAGGDFLLGLLAISLQVRNNNQSKK
jgi:hypothetical protein